MTNKCETQPQKVDTYQAYLVRMWQDGYQAVWRASAQSVQSGEIVRFADLDRLFAFLKAQADVNAQTVDLAEGERNYQHD